MNGMQVLRYLDWPRFLRVFGVVDVAALVIPGWALALRMNGAAEDSPALDNLRQLSLDAHQELLDLLSDAAERIKPERLRPRTALAPARSGGWFDCRGHAADGQHV